MTELRNNVQLLRYAALGQTVFKELLLLGVSVTLWSAIGNHRDTQAVPTFRSKKVSCTMVRITAHFEAEGRDF
jgi:hypothetical protein